MSNQSRAPRTVNKGEWSEIYAFFKVIVDRNITAADENLVLTPGKTFPVLSVVRSEKREGEMVTLKYDLTQEVNTVTIKDNSGTVLKVVDLSDLRRGVRRIFQAISNSVGTTFELPEAEKFMEELLCDSIKAASSDKSDINLVLQDRFAPSPVQSGFSIKTAYRSAATLLNASKKNTSFLYEVVKDHAEAPIPVNDRVRETVKSIYTLGRLKFIDVESDVFRNNLKYIDSNFVNILAAMLANYHRGLASKISDLVALLPEDPELKKSRQTQEFYKHKVKQFLEAVALGMTPGTVWEGNVQANGGFIVIKDDGELACFHLYDREKFLEYLYTHTKFDSPSTGRHEYGSVETTTTGVDVIRLNLQIRFL